jgi:hypothetical protein
MRLDTLASAINEINDLLDSAEAAHGAEADELRRKSAIKACRTYSELLEDPALEEDLAELRRAQLEVSAEAAELLNDRQRLVTAEGQLFLRLGIEPKIVDGLVADLQESNESLDPDDLALDRLREIRSAICALRENLGDEAQREHRRTRIWGAVMGIGGVVIIGGNVPLLGVFPPGAVASGAVGGGLVTKGLDRVSGE